MKAECDFCGEKKEVIRTNYGTTHYVRLMCENCKKKIEKRNNFKVKNLDDKSSK